MSSVPSSTHATCLVRCFGSAKGRRDDVHVIVLVWAIMQPLLEFVIEAGIRASGGGVVNRGWSVVWVIVNVVIFIG